MNVLRKIYRYFSFTHWVKGGFRLEILRFKGHGNLSTSICDKKRRTGTMTLDNTSVCAENKSRKIRTDNGVFEYSWEDDASVSPHGYLPFFSQYLSGANLFSDFVSDCPLHYTSNNAPEVKDVLGTVLLSVLSGHSRYRQMQNLYGDGVAAELLGIGRTVSHDSVQRGLTKMDEKEAEDWLRKHLLRSYEPLLTVPYVLDMDPTVKPLYGNQEGAEIGYNPHKPGRPSHCYHTYVIGSLRLVMDIQVKPGNQTAGCHSHDGLWRILDSLPRRLRPEFVRGDIGFGNDSTMNGCEARMILYVFKLKQTSKVKELIAKLEQPSTVWLDAGEGWEGIEKRLKLTGWKKSRRVVVLRRLRKAVQRTPEAEDNGSGLVQMEFNFAEPVEEIPEYEYQVIVTSLDSPIPAIAQFYRDRADCENVYDELKNQWGWTGFTTRDIKRCRIMAAITALVYNWWNIFSRLAEPERHVEARTARSVFTSSVAKLICSGRQRIIRLAVPGNIAQKVRETFDRVADFLQKIATAAQLTQQQKWTRILMEAFRCFDPMKDMKTTADGDQMLLLL
jgi:hypothetical protein